MASEYETVEDIVKELQGIKGGQHTNGGLSFERWRTRCQFADDYADRIKAAHQRDIAEFKRKAREANLKYRAEKARHTDTYKDARIKAQDEEIATLKREVAELRECLGQAYGDKTGTYTMRGNEVERWRKALREKGETK